MTTCTCQISGWRAVPVAVAGGSGCANDPAPSFASTSSPSPSSAAWAPQPSSPITFFRSNSGPPPSAGLEFFVLVPSGESCTATRTTAATTAARRSERLTLVLICCGSPLLLLLRLPRDRISLRSSPSAARPSMAQLAGWKTDRIVFWLVEKRIPGARWVRQNWAGFVVRSAGELRPS